MTTSSPGCGGLGLVLHLVPSLQLPLTPFVQLTVAAWLDAVATATNAKAASPSLVQRCMPNSPFHPCENPERSRPLHPPPLPKPETRLPQSGIDCQRQRGFTSHGAHDQTGLCSGNGRYSLERQEESVEQRESGAVLGRVKGSL